MVDPQKENLASILFLSKEISKLEHLFQDCQLAGGKQIQLAVSSSKIIMAGNATASGEFISFL